MKKLNKRKLEWIIGEMKKGNLSVYQIAKQQKISKWHVWRLYKKYLQIRELPVPKPPGRKPEEIPEKERKLVLEMKKKHPAGPVALEIILKREKEIHIPHNKIYRILKEAGYVKNQPNKQKKRKFCRYERKHTNSLWHGDWTELDRKNLLIYEDDASRLITGYGLFDKATTDHSIEVFEAGVREFGVPKQLHTDHGSQFHSNEGPIRKTGKSRFKQRVKELGTQHILARISHPQGNGKLERLFQTIEKLYKHFGSLDEAVYYYNYKRFHMSLGNGEPETPHEAYLRKMKKNGQKKEIS